MRKYRIKEYDEVVHDYKSVNGFIVEVVTNEVRKRYKIEFNNGWFYGWESLDTVYDSEEAARTKIEAYKLRDEVDRGRGVRYINVD